MFAKLRTTCALVFRGLQNPGSLRARVAMSLFVIFSCTAVAIFALLSFTGLLSLRDEEFSQFLDYALTEQTEDIDRLKGSLATHGIDFSRQMTAAIEETLSKHQTIPPNLNNNPALLYEIQERAYPILTAQMQQTPCSGAFFLLRATVNTQNAQNAQMRTASGMYIKIANLYSDNTLQNELAMFRGDFDVARRHDLHLYSAWQLELTLDAIPGAADMLVRDPLPLTRAGTLTRLTQLTDSWETARFFVLPIYDKNGGTVGLCGFEISTLYYQLRSHVPIYKGHELSVVHLDRNEDGTYQGHFANEASLQTEEITLSKDGDLTVIDHGKTRYIGKVSQLSRGVDDHLIAVLLPDNVYKDLTKGTRRAALLVFVALLAVAALVWKFLDARYLTPLLAGLKVLREEPRQNPRSSITEINEVFMGIDRLAAARDDEIQTLSRDRMDARSAYTDATNQLRSIIHRQQEMQIHRRTMEAEIRRLQKELAAERVAMQSLQTQKDAAEQQYIEARTTLQTVLDKKWDTVDRRELEFFKSHIKELTKKERAVFDAYIDGKNGKETAELLSITDNTLKYHNKNIYSKLGIKSRKELLRFWTLCKDEEK